MNSETGTHAVSETWTDSRGRHISTAAALGRGPRAYDQRPCCRHPNTTGSQGPANDRVPVFGRSSQAPALTDANWASRACQTASLSSEARSGCYSPDTAAPTKECAAHDGRQVTQGHFSLLSLSYGAPVPDEPRNTFRPSAKVTSRPFALRDPSFAWKPSTTISSPGVSAPFVRPRRYSTFGVPASIPQRSTLPSGFFTSMRIQVCGFIHSTFVTTPLSLIGLVPSNSAANE
jgi:hypothetical protein